MKRKVNYYTDELKFMAIQEYDYFYLKLRNMSSMKNLLLSSVILFAVLFSLVKVPEKDEWYIAYHRRPKGYTSPNHRETKQAEPYLCY